MELIWREMDVAVLPSSDHVGHLFYLFGGECWWGTREERVGSEDVSRPVSSKDNVV